MNVSVIGLGTLGFVRAGMCDEGRKGLPEIEKIVNRALDRGVNIFDTSDIYAKGIAEEGLGRVMETRRKEAVILSRTPMYRASDDPDEMTRCIEASLERLNTDVIDIYQLHDVSSDEWFEKTVNQGMYEALEKAKKSGKVRFIGFSTHGGFELAAGMMEKCDVDVLTVSHNILGKKRSAGDKEDLGEISEKLFPLAKEKNTGITVMKPLGGGVLGSEGPGGKRLSAARLIRYVLQTPGVHAVTPGVDNMEQLEEALKAGDASFSLSPEDMKSLEAEAQKWGEKLCRSCGYCKPCPQEIDIPKVLKSLMDWERTGKDSVREAYGKLDVKAGECVACGECEERCPYHLPISDMMEETAAALDR